MSSTSTCAPTDPAPLAVPTAVPASMGDGQPPVTPQCPLFHTGSIAEHVPTSTGHLMPHRRTTSQPSFPHTTIWDKRCALHGTSTAPTKLLSATIGQITRRVMMHRSDPLTHMVPYQTSLPTGEQPNGCYHHQIVHQGGACILQGSSLSTYYKQRLAPGSIGFPALAPQVAMKYSI